MFRLLLQSLLDPRGRVNRIGLLYVAGGLLALQVITYGLAWAGLYHPRTIGVQFFELMALWICMAAAIKRLHDIGYGAIWVLIGFAAEFCFALMLVVGVLVTMGQAALDEGSSSYWTVIGLTMLPALVGTIWLHIQPGQQWDNRFGDVPGRTGFGAPTCDKAGVAALAADTA